MADYCSQTDLENAIGKSIVSSAYDDDESGSADSTPVASCLAYATAMCNSYMRNFMMTSGKGAITLPLTDVPDEVKFAAIDFAIAYTFRRRPELMRAIGATSWKEYFDFAREQMQRYCEAKQKLPSTVGQHAADGADLAIPETDVDSDCEPDGEHRWADMGDFS